MKNVIRCLYVILLCSSSIHLTYSRLAQPTFKEDLLHLPMVNKELAHLLDQHNEELAEKVKKIHSSPLQKHGVWTFDWLPGYYVKYNISRVRKREILAKCIHKMHLHLMHTPKKYLYHIKGRPTKLHHLNYVVIIKEVQHDPAADTIPMTLEQVEQLTTLILKTGHISTHASNYLRLADGRLSFIDTDGTFDKSRAVIGLIRLLRRNLETYYTQDALYFILTTIAHKLATLHGPKKANAYRLLVTLLQQQKPEVEKKITILLKNHTYV